MMGKSEGRPVGQLQWHIDAVPVAEDIERDDLTHLVGKPDVDAELACVHFQRLAIEAKDDVVAPDPRVTGGVGYEVVLSKGEAPGWQVQRLLLLRGEVVALDTGRRLQAAHG